MRDAFRDDLFPAGAQVSGERDLAHRIDLEGSAHERIGEMLRCALCTDGHGVHEGILPDGSDARPAKRDLLALDRRRKVPCAMPRV